MKYKPFIAKCTKTVEVEGQKGYELLFMEDGLYESCWPEVWPDTTMTVALIDHQQEEHFMDWKWFHEHFVKL